MTSDYPPTEACNACKGRCCRQQPGIYSPKDFTEEQLTPEGIAALINSGDYSVDWWEGDPRQDRKCKECGDQTKDTEQICYFCRQQKKLPDITYPEGGLSQSYFIRPRTDHNRDHGYYGLWSGTCKHLTDTGCRLRFEKRPLGCRSLEPKEKNCKAHIEKKTIVLQWMKYNPIISKAIPLIGDY